jgi:hypothetical protein
MALTAEDLAQLGEFIEKKIESVVEGKVGEAVATATTPVPQTNDEPQNQPENQPDFYIHLADGSVIVSKDSQSTHMENSEGEALQVVGRYPKGA